MIRKLQLVVVAAVAAAWMAPAAQATDYCVAPNTSCGGTNVGTFEAALDAADNANDADRIFLGAATYKAAAATGFSYDAPGSPVEVLGAGTGQTILTGQIGGSGSMLFLVGGAGSSIHDLTMRLPQNAAAGFAGLTTNRLARRIEVVEALTQANVRTGVRLPGGSLEDSTVMIGGVQNTTGVSTFFGSVRDSTIEARNAVVVDSAATLERLVLRGGAVGLHAQGSTTITDSLIEVTEPTGTAISTRTQPLQDATVNTDGVTLVGPGTAGSTGAHADTSQANPQNATVNLANAVLRGFGQALVTFANGAGEADINASYSDYDPSGNSDTGPGSITASNVTNLGDARFVNAASGDFRLRFDSPLIDVGEPGAPTTSTDLGGGARLVDGDAVPGARRDIGAYEYQAQPPLAAISGPAAALAGAQVTFSGEGSSDADPGDTIAAYAWTVDGVPAGGEPTLNAVFQTAGAHSVGLTVTDPSGHHGSTAQVITVTGLPIDTTAPVISNLRARPARVQRGRPVSFRFSLDEAASVRVKIQRVMPGRREAGACRKPSARNRDARRCTRRVLVTSLTKKGTSGANRVRFPGKVRGRALPKGRYQALVIATDAAGNRSASRRTSFTVS
jgi:hypothetical protein